MDGREKEAAAALSNGGKSTHQNHYFVFSDLLFNHMHWNVYTRWKTDANIVVIKVNGNKNLKRIND